MSWTDDPVRDANEYFNAQEEKLERLPKCCECGEPIQQEEAVEIDGNWYCEDCEDKAWEKIRKEYLVKTKEN